MREWRTGDWTWEQAGSRLAGGRNTENRACLTRIDAGQVWREVCRERQAGDTRGKKKQKTKTPINNPLPIKLTHTHRAKAEDT